MVLGLNPTISIKSNMSYFAHRSAVVLLNTESLLLLQSLLHLNNKHLSVVWTGLSANHYQLIGNIGIGVFEGTFKISKTNFNTEWVLRNYRTTKLLESV